MLKEVREFMFAEQRNDGEAGDDSDSGKYRKDVVKKDHKLRRPEAGDWKIQAQKFWVLVRINLASMADIFLVLSINS